MKKIILSLLCFASTFGALAQTNFLPGQAKAVLATNGLARDTVSNTGSESWTLKAAGDASCTISFVISITKISGTLGGSFAIQGSNDGVEWADLETAYTVTDVAAQTKKFDYDYTKYVFYRCRWTGTGSMSGSAVVSAALKKRSL